MSTAFRIAGVELPVVVEESTPDSLKALLARLRKERRADERVLKDVAKSVGVTLQAVQRWETDEDRPSIERMRRWLLALSLPEEWSELYVEFRATEQLDALMDRYAIDEDYQRVIRLSFRDGLRHGRGGGAVPKKFRAAGSSR